MGQIFQPIIGSADLVTTPKAWLDILGQVPCVVSGSDHTQLHHCVRRKAKHNKVPIGEWFVIPLHPRYHDVSSDNPFNVTHWKNRFEIEFGTQRDLFSKMVDQLREAGHPVPADFILEAIEAYR